MADLFVERKIPILNNSDFLKIVVAGYFRFSKGYKFVTTEYNYQDVTVCNGKYFYEIECKVSKSDLKNELKNKKIKHKNYRNYSLIKSQYTPNKFYFAITKDMANDKDCLDFINELNPNYGIIMCSNWRTPYVIKEAKFLHKDVITDKVKEEIVARLSSENINLRLEMYKSKYCLNN